MNKFRPSKLFASMIVTSVLSVNLYAAPASPPTQSTQPQAKPLVIVNPTVPKIQIALLLDTSSSMDGLIDQTRVQLWQMVDELSRAKKNGQTPSVEVAVFEYGNDYLSEKNGYVRQVVGFTNELDRVSEALFALTTNGGSEYCGYVIREALNKLQWSRKTTDMQMIIIAGNEPFSQGPIAFRDAVASATKTGITVSTIYAGDYQEGASTGWQEAATLAGGNFMNIDQNQAIVHISAPQDQRIAELNQALNDTYVPYGSEGKIAVERQINQDKQNAAVSSELAAKRSKVKTLSVYKNTQWDLLDAVEEDAVKLEALPATALPQEMQAMNLEQKKDYLAEKKQNREKLKAEIQQLSKDREDFVAEKKAALANAPASPDMNKAISEALASQASQKQFELPAAK